MHSGKLRLSSRDAATAEEMTLPRIRIKVQSILEFQDEL